MGDDKLKEMVAVFKEDGEIDRFVLKETQSIDNANSSRGAGGKRDNRGGDQKGNRNLFSFFNKKNNNPSTPATPTNPANVNEGDGEIIKSYDDLKKPIIKYLHSREEDDDEGFEDAEDEEFAHDFVPTPTNHTANTTTNATNTTNNQPTSANKNTTKNAATATTTNHFEDLNNTGAGMNRFELEEMINKKFNNLQNIILQNQALNTTTTATRPHVSVREEEFKRWSESFNSGENMGKQNLIDEKVNYLFKQQFMNLQQQNNLIEQQNNLEHHLNSYIQQHNAILENRINEQNNVLDEKIKHYNNLLNNKLNAILNSKINNLISEQNNLLNSKLNNIFLEQNNLINEQNNLINEKLNDRLSENNNIINERLNSKLNEHNNIISERVKEQLKGVVEQQNTLLQEVVNQQNTLINQQNELIREQNSILNNELNKQTELIQELNSFINENLKEQNSFINDNLKEQNSFINGLMEKQMVTNNLVEKEYRTKLSEKVKAIEEYLQEQFNQHTIQINDSLKEYHDGVDKVCGLVDTLKMTMEQDKEEVMGQMDKCNDGVNHCKEELLTNINSTLDTTQELVNDYKKEVEDYNLVMTENVKELNLRIDEINENLQNNLNSHIKHHKDLILEHNNYINDKIEQQNNLIAKENDLIGEQNERLQEQSEYIDKMYRDSMENINKLNDNLLEVNGNVNLLDGHLEQCDSRLDELEKELEVKVGQLGGKLQDLEQTIGQVIVNTNSEIDRMTAQCTEGLKDGFNTFVKQLNLVNLEINKEHHLLKERLGNNVKMLLEDVNKECQLVVKQVTDSCNQEVKIVVDELKDNSLNSITELKKKSDLLRVRLDQAIIKYNEFLYTINDNTKGSGNGYSFVGATTSASGSNSSGSRDEMIMKILKEIQDTLSGSSNNGSGSGSSNGGSASTNGGVCGSSSAINSSTNSTPIITSTTPIITNNVSTSGGVQLDMRCEGEEVGNRIINYPIYTNPNNYYHYSNGITNYRVEGNTDYRVDGNTNYFNTGTSYRADGGNGYNLGTSYVPVNGRLIKHSREVMSLEEYCRRVQ